MSSKSELVALLSNSSALSEFIAASFTEADTDKNGSIDKNELKAALIKLCGVAGLSSPSDNDIDETYKAADVNQDGSISSEEYGQFIKNFIGRL